MMCVFQVGTVCIERKGILSKMHQGYGSLEIRTRARELLLSTGLQGSECLQFGWAFSVCFVTSLITNNVNFRSKVPNPGRLGVFSGGCLNHHNCPCGILLATLCMHTYSQGGQKQPVCSGMGSIVGIIFIICKHITSANCVVAACVSALLSEPTKSVRPVLIPFVSC